MNLPTEQHRRHLEDADLIRLRDGECDSSEEPALRAHLATCPKCQESAERLDRLVKGFLAMAGEIQAPAEIRFPVGGATGVPDRRASRRGLNAFFTLGSLRVAAIVAIVLGLALATAPARALVRSGWRTLAGLFERQPVRQTSVLPEEQTVGEPLTDSDVQGLAKSASFVPRGEAFLISLAQRQTLGTISVTIDTVSRATVEVLGTDDSAELVVFDAGVRIHNEISSSSSYEFALPEVLRSIEVQVAGRTIAVLSPAELPIRTAWLLDLAGVEGR